MRQEIKRNKPSEAYRQENSSSNFICRGKNTTLLPAGMRRKSMQTLLRIFHKIFYPSRNFAAGTFFSRDACSSNLHRTYYGKGCPTATLQSWPGCPCAGFNFPVNAPDDFGADVLIVEFCNAGATGAFCAGAGI
jgi:hypothetical protein